MDSDSGKYNVTARLFKIIHDLSPEKQFILYKQLVKDTVCGELFKLIIDLPEDRKIQLLGQLGENLFEDEPLKTVNLDNDRSFMRNNPRKNCLISVECQIENRSFKSYIIDISRVGAFVESKKLFPIGQKMIMVFKLPNYHSALQLNGHISRSTPRGIVVKFYKLSPTQEDIILKFIENQK